MNYGLVISYIIAGFLMLTILTITYNVGFSNQEVTSTLIVKTQSQAISEMITHDIPKIGYDKKTVLNTKFNKVDSTEISFYGNIDDQGGVELVTWKYTDLPAPAHRNPNAFILSRIVDGDEISIGSGITRFRVWYYDTYGATTPMSFPINSSDYDDIRQIEIEFELQSSFKLNYRASDDGDHVISSWQKRFSPVNLRPN